MDAFITALQDWAAGAQIWAENMTRPRQFIQIAAILALWGISHVIARRFLQPALKRWMHGLKGLKASQLRFLIAIQQRTRMILFALLAWLTSYIIGEVTWPSRGYLIGLAATLAAAIAIVAITARLIKNPLLRNVIKYSAWAWVTLSVLGFWNQTRDILDKAVLQMGEVSISALLIAKAVILLIILLTLASWGSRLVSDRLRNVDELSPSMRVLSEKVITIALYGTAIIFAVRSIGFDLTSLAVLSGAIGIGVGFGLQKVVSNFVSGFILLLDKSIKPGDVISLGDTFGWIQSLSARYVSVVTRDGREYLIPNEDLITGQVVNWSHSNDLVRLDINFGVSYDSDPHYVRQIAIDAAKTIDRVQSDPSPVCHVVGFGDSSVDFVLRFWISDPSSGLTNIRGLVYLALWDTLKANEIEIPFPKRDVMILNDKATLPQD